MAKDSSHSPHSSHSPLFSLSFHPFHDLSDVLQQHLLHEMVKSFQKPWADLTHLRTRFLRPSCRVGLFRQDGVLKAAAFLWREPDVLYLDKFFVFYPYRNQRIGTPFLSHLLEHLFLSSLPLCPSLPLPLLWRTDSVLAARFYGKHPLVRTRGTHGEYVYQTAGHWPYSPYSSYSPSEDTTFLPLLRMPSAFQPIAISIGLKPSLPSPS